MVFLRKLQLKEIEIIAFLYTDNFQNLKFKCQSKLKQAKISDKKEQRFGDIVTPFSSSNAKKINSRKIRSRLTYFVITYAMSRK